MVKVSQPADPAYWSFYAERKSWLTLQAFSDAIRGGRGIRSGPEDGGACALLDKQKALEASGHPVLPTADGRVSVLVYKCNWIEAHRETWTDKYLMGHKFIIDFGYSEQGRGYRQYDAFYEARKPWKFHTIAASIHLAGELGVDLHLVEKWARDD
jgi:hypothetical protein